MGTSLHLGPKEPNLAILVSLLPRLAAEDLVEALHSLPRLSAHASRPSAAPAYPAPLWTPQTPHAPRVVSPSPAICDCHRSCQRCFQPPPRRGGRHEARTAGPAIRCASDDASAHATARPWARRASAPAASNANDAQPACTADHPFLAARPAPQPTGCATPSTAPRPKSQKAGSRLPWAWRSAAVAKRHLPSRSCADGAREDPPSAAPDHLSNPK